MIKELKATAKLMQGKTLDTVYIGGGTPTTLEADQLDRLLGTIRENFDLEHVLEFTVEAGRPDSITREKLEVIRKYPVTRISVNPQTMQQKTLDLVGRKHTVEDVEQIFHLARELGFDNINMDLIAGLPGEDAADMQDTLEKIEKLHPDSLTVHALAIKRAAKFGQEGRTMDPGTEITQMVEAAAASAERMGLVPYYLYRQKNIAGNFENVGYAEQDKAGVYNILIMERLMGTKSDIRWFQNFLQIDSDIEVLELSDIYPNKGTDRYYRSYAEVERKDGNAGRPTENGKSNRKNNTEKSK